MFKYSQTSVAYLFNVVVPPQLVVHGDSKNLHLGFEALARVVKSSDLWKKFAVRIITSGMLGVHHVVLVWRKCNTGWPSPAEDVVVDLLQPLAVVGV